MISYTIRTDDELQLIYTVVTGTIKAGNGEHIIIESRNAAAENGYDILYDMTGTVTKVNLTSWFQLPRTLDVFKQAAARLIKAAIVIPQDDSSVKQYKFFETVTRNLGLSVKIFFTEEEALKWLDRKS
jgi:hypothetical protein